MGGGAGTTEEAEVGDRALLTAVASGDRHALRTLYDRHDGWIRARLRRRCGDDDLVAEAVQDTFVAVWRSAATFRAEGEPAAWLWGIAARRLVDAQRRRNRWEPPACDTDDAADDRAFDRTTDAADLLAAMGQLPAPLLAAVRATYIDDLSVAEAATLLGIPPGTVKNRVHRAKLLLRGSLS